MPRETQASICSWANAVFTNAGSDARTAVRAMEEQVEFTVGVTQGRPDPVELADTIIVLTRLATRWNTRIDNLQKTPNRYRSMQFHTLVDVSLQKMTSIVLVARRGEQCAQFLVEMTLMADALCRELGKDLWQLIDDKMVVNRRREWKVVDGHGYHIEEGVAA